MQSYHASPIVDIRVGASEPQKIFHIHQQLLEQNSHHFQALAQSWTPSTTPRLVTLPHLHPDAFEIFGKYIYNHRDVGDLDILSAIQAYLLGVRLEAQAFKERMLQVLLDSLRWATAMSADQVVELMTIVYVGTSQGDPLRQVLASHRWAVTNDMATSEASDTAVSDNEGDSRFNSHSPRLASAEVFGSPDTLRATSAFGSTGFTTRCVKLTIWSVTIWSSKLSLWSLTIKFTMFWPWKFTTQCIKLTIWSLTIWSSKLNLWSLTIQFTELRLWSFATRCFKPTLRNPTTWSTKLGFWIPTTPPLAPHLYIFRVYTLHLIFRGSAVPPLHIARIPHYLALLYPAARSTAHRALLSDPGAQFTPTISSFPSCAKHALRPSGPSFYAHAEQPSLRASTTTFCTQQPSLLPSTPIICTSTNHAKHLRLHSHTGVYNPSRPAYLPASPAPTTQNNQAYSPAPRPFPPIAIPPTANPHHSQAYPAAGYTQDIHYNPSRPAHLPPSPSFPPITNPQDNQAYPAFPPTANPHHSQGYTRDGPYASVETAPNSPIGESVPGFPAWI
ncbi:hypothetical protein G7Y79_00007g022650 [Physcia stellaris]|nr:hypothetical protein G7Y79_00007g022650 [Physcia stellaris]